MQKWEYLVFALNVLGQEDLNSRLEALGNDGWELVTVLEGSVFYFKRPKH